MVEEEEKLILGIVMVCVSNRDALKKERDAPRCAFLSCTTKQLNMHTCVETAGSSL